MTKHLSIGLSLLLGAMFVAPCLAQEQNPNISIDIKDEDVSKVLEMLFSVTKFNRVIDPAVKGVVSLTLTDVPWNQAVKYVLDQGDAAMRRDANNVYHIYPKAKPKRETAPANGMPGMMPGMPGMPEAPAGPRKAEAADTEVNSVHPDTAPTYLAQAPAPAEGGKATPSKVEEEPEYHFLPIQYVWAGDIALFFGGGVLSSQWPSTSGGGGGRGGLGGGLGGGGGFGGGGLGGGGGFGGGGYGGGGGGFGGGGGGFGGGGGGFGGGGFGGGGGGFGGGGFGGGGGGFGGGGFGGGGRGGFGGGF